jgi:hypothetical protein
VARQCGASEWAAPLLGLSVPADLIHIQGRLLVPLLTPEEYVNYRLAAQYLSWADWQKLHSNPGSVDEEFIPGFRLKPLYEPGDVEFSDVKNPPTADVAAVSHMRTTFLNKGSRFAKKVGGAIRDKMDFVRFDKAMGTSGGKSAVRKAIGSAIVKTHQELKKIAADILPQIDKELLMLGTYLVQLGKERSIDLEWVQGPIKTTGSTLEKVIKRIENPSTRDKPGKLDALFNIFAMKDLVRGTLVAQQKHDLDVAVQLIFATCYPAYGMALPKQEETIPGKGNECGYSGWNFNVVFRHCGFPAEIQVNTVAMIYAKETKKVFMELTHWDEAKYDELARDKGILGGLGHVCYEIYRTHKQMPLPQAAAKFSRGYYDAFRLENPKASLPKIVQELRELSKFVQNATEADHPNIAKIKDKKEGVWGHAGVEEWLQKQA